MDADPEEQEQVSDERGHGVGVCVHHDGGAFLHVR